MTETPSSSKGFPPDYPSRIATNEYGHYCLPEPYIDRELPRVLLAGQVYEPETLRFLCRHLRGGDIVTGGAFVGDFFPALAAALAPGARIISFEPNPLSHQACLATLGLNAIDCVDLAPVAVGEASGTVTLRVARGQAGAALAAGARIVPSDQAGEGTIEVPVTTLDDLVPQGRSVSLLHLDVEGFERPALRGARRLLRDCRPTVVLEGTRPRERRQFLRVLNAHFEEATYVDAGIIERNSVYLATK